MNKQELVKMVADKVGISQDKANTAVDTVLGYVKSNLPQGIASQIDNVVGGGSSSGGGGIGGAIGGMLGGDKK